MSTWVDKIMGEENDIILLASTSNQEGKVFSLDIQSRHLRTLSHAEEGMHCIGNMVTRLAGAGQDHPHPFERIRINGCVQILQNHPDTHFSIQSF